MNISEKLMEIQQSLKAPKGQFNSFGKYSYRSAEDILEAVKPLLKDNKIVLTLSDNIQCIGGRVYVQATARLMDTETTEDIYCTAFAREEESKKGMDGSQVTGASSSYARKYALNGLFAIDDNKDSDSTNVGATTESKLKDVKEPTEKQPKAGPDGYYYCDECGNIIKTILTNGSSVSSSEIAARTLKKFGKQLCSNCAKNESKAN